jgi:hypothetical protein
MEPTTRRGFLKITAAAASLGVVTVGLSSLGKRPLGWRALAGGPDCPQALSFHRLGAEDTRRFSVTLLVETPSESLALSLPSIAMGRGVTSFEVPLSYPYTTYAPGAYRFRVQLRDGDEVFETVESAYYELFPFRWFA